MRRYVVESTDGLYYCADMQDGRYAYRGHELHRARVFDSVEAALQWIAQMEPTKWCGYPPVAIRTVEETRTLKIVP